MERTLVLVKPDGVQRSLIGVVLARLEQRGLRIVAMKMLQLNEALARQHYAPLAELPFFPGLIRFISSGPLVAAVVEGPRAIELVRQTMGATDPGKAGPGTIRGDFGLDIGRNVIHGSDSAESAKREITLFFRPDEIVDYRRDVDSWIVEAS